MSNAKTRVHFPMNKKAISELVSYVLLISLAVAMSGAVYAWLNFYVKNPFPEESCPEVRLIIQDYNCAAGKILNLTVQNRGRFDVDGYIIKINNGSSRDYNIYEMFHIINGIPSPNYVPFSMEVGASSTGLFNYTAFNKITAVEIEAVKGVDRSQRPILCKDSVVRQSIACN